MIAESFHNLAKQTRIRDDSAYNLLLTRRPTIDLGGISGKNFLNGLVRHTQELAKSITKTNSKMREPKTYDQAANNLINKNRWQKAIDKEL